ncbi:MAG: hypothetical protein LBF40_09485 [Deltaproteobacteria bacterium]|jgi:hypothetical protein|nr:hypothetical protein [Deltaproteobacteria bacterium]
MASLDHIICTNCGASIDLEPGVFEYICPYCDTKNTIVDPHAPKNELPDGPDKMVLIRASKEELHSFLLQKMAEDLNSPDDLIEASDINEEKLYYVPCYFSAGSVVADWTASFGYDREEPYTDYVTYTDSNGRSRTRPVTRYRTVTDWKPASGRASGKFLTQAYAGEPIPGLVEGGLNALKGDLVSYTPTMVTGCEVKPFMKGIEDVRTTLDSLVNKRIRSIVYSYAQGDHQRNWSYDPHITVDYEKPGLLPLAKCTFTYKEKQYSLYADAVNLVMFYRDAFPVDVKRQQKVSRAYVPFYITLVYAAIMALLCASHYELFKAIPILIGLCAPLLFGILRKTSVTSYSKKVRAAALALKDMNENAQLKSQDEIQRLYKLSRKPPMPFFAKDGSDNFMLPILTFVWIGLCGYGILSSIL